MTFFYGGGEGKGEGIDTMIDDSVQSLIHDERNSSTR